MPDPNPIQTLDVDNDASFYLARIRQIDKIVQAPVKTLIGLSERQSATEDGSGSQMAELYLPTWISPELKPENEDNRLTQAICGGTLQRIWRLRRRFQWLDKKSVLKLKKVRETLKASFTPSTPGDFYECAQLLDSKTFGGLNPLTASQVFRILLDAGEDYAHSGIGFLAFFAMIWPLSRSFPNRLTIGARIEPWEVTAYVTAKCLLPIRKLQGIIARRAQLYDDIANNLRQLARTADRDNARDLWLFNIELDALRANLSHLSQLAINKKTFTECAESIAASSKQQQLGNQAVYANVLESLKKALEEIKNKSEQVLLDARTIVDLIEDEIVKPLRPRKGKRKTLAKKIPFDSLTKTLHLRFAAEYLNNSLYRADLAEAAYKSIGYCRDALSELEAACKICSNPKVKSVDSLSLQEPILQALTSLGDANRKVKDVLNRPVKDAALWCRNVVDREIAHASAENFTDFDPSELVSAIAVAVGWNLMSTRLQVSDAVTKAIAGARKDGSWRSGKPFYSPDHASGIWAMTSDIVWTLTSAMEQFPGVRDADQELFNFVNWLERTQISLPARYPVQAGETDQKPTDPLAPPEQSARDYVGWASERLRDRSKIHLGTTALSINALLEVRDLAEYRLWELCKKRFSVLSIDKPLREIDPVDLGAVHSQRLHRHLEQMAYRARVNHEDAKYSLVLHGPPGSSKTKLAEALSVEMWKFSNRWGPKETRLIRITPADFTRLGEDRLDSEARAIFDLISGVRAVTVLFDEIDDLLRQRNANDERPRFMDLVVPAMLNRLADLRSACPRQEISFILATNYVENIDSALIRIGRIDASIPVVYPDFASRVAIIISETNKNLAKDKYKDKAQTRTKITDFLKSGEQYKEIASRTAAWPYLALTSLCGSLVDKIMDTWSVSDREAAFKKVLDDGIAEYHSGFSLPDYEPRLERLERRSQELLNEYCHHIISQPREASDCLALLDRNFKLSKINASVVEHLNETLTTVLKSRSNSK